MKVYLIRAKNGELFGVADTYDTAERFVEYRNESDLTFAPFSFTEQLVTDRNGLDTAIRLRGINRLTKLEKEVLSL